MSKQYNSYTEEFKKTIVALYKSGKKVAELVHEYDIEKKQWSYSHKNRR